MEVNYEAKISRWDHDKNFWVEEDQYKFRPGQTVFLATRAPEIREVQVVKVAYPEGYEYRWVVKDVTGDAEYIIGDSNLFASYAAAYEAMYEQIVQEIATYERRAIVTKAQLQQFEEQFKCPLQNLPSPSTTNTTP